MLINSCRESKAANTREGSVEKEGRICSTWRRGRGKGYRIRLITTEEGSAPEMRGVTVQILSVLPTLERGARYLPARKDLR